MLFRGQGLAFVVQHLQGTGYLGTGVAGRDHRIDLAAVGRDVGVEQGVLVVQLAARPQRVDLIG